MRKNHFVPGMPLTACAAIAAVASIASITACSQSRTACDRICDWEVECWGRCDYSEDPDCDQDALANLTRENCMEYCAAPEDPDADTRNAATAYADCLDSMSCDNMPAGECRIAEMRYNEIYLAVPGEWVCGYLCGEIETGCIPWETFGYRGNDCVENCKNAARVPACREALYDHDDCTPGTTYSCFVHGDQCVATQDAVNTACDGLAPADHIPQDDATCAEIAGRWCDCGLKIVETDCLETAQNQCRFQLGKGQSCVDAMNTFDGCMRTIPECERETLRDTCEPVWSDWVTSCLY